MKKRIFPLITIMVMTSMALTSCIVPFQRVLRGSGNIITESREVSDFSRVRLDGAGTLTITQGETESLEIEADDNILPALSSNVDENTLILSIEDKWWQQSVIPTEKINYTLTVIDLSDITINGAADLDIEDFETSSLTIKINGAGNIEIIDLTANEFNFEINGTANGKLSGEVDEISIMVNGMGNVNADDLLTSTADVEINGLGNATVWAEDLLSVSISGGGSLSYYGSPTISQNISGSGDITSLGEK